MKRFFFLSAVLSVSAIAAPIGACVQGTLRNLIGNPCGMGDMMFDNFAYSGNVPASRVRGNFAMGNEFHLAVLAPFTGADVFTNFSSADRVSVISGLAQNILSASSQILGVKDQSKFSAVNTPGPTLTSVPGSETGAGPTTLTTISTLTGPGGTDGADPGLGSLDLENPQANAAIPAIPEPAPFALIGIALLGGGLLRKRSVYR